ncbi:MAG: alpha/beta hydrolase family protein [Gammaproteobacteria bacterium]|nr:alpha/beta hydrolase family protein [Gammaproteobacteria bacterium]
MKNSLVLLLYVLFPCLSLFAPASHAASKSDLAKEKRWEEQIVPGIMIGDAVKLNADGVEFLALYAEATADQAKGAVVLLHGIGVHPAWPDVIEPLRMQLPENGWHTLSLQMPVLKNEAEDKDYPPLFPEVPARIQAGVDFLKSKGLQNIVISGHSLGSAMAAYYLAVKRDPVVKGYAIISGGPGVKGDPLMDSLENFKKIKDMRILDIYGSEDMEQVLESGKKRNALGPKIHGNRYQNLKIDGAGHFYRENPEELVKQVSSWLDINIAEQ